MPDRDPLRIVLFTSKLLWGGGIGNVVAGMGSALADRGHEVHLAGPAPDGPPDPIPATTLHVWPKRGMKLGQLPLLWRLLRETRADVLHTHSALPHGDVLAGLRAWRAIAGRPRIFVSAHTSARADYPKRRARLGLRLADAVIQSNTWSAGNAIRAGAPREHTHVLNNGVAPAERVPDPEKREHVLVMIGRFVPAKGVDVLIEAFQIAGATRPDWKLVIGGFGRDEEALRRQAGAGACADRIELPGGVYGEGKRDLLERAAIGVVPSRDENSPQIFQEFQAAGLACVVSDVGGLGDLARDDGALLVPPEDPAALATTLGRVMDDSELRGRLARGALERARELSWPAIAERLEALYRRYGAGAR